MTTLVLVRGAWPSSRCWDSIRTRLEALGHQVVAHRGIEAGRVKTLLGFGAPRQVSW
jgi:hypothetical protein